MNETTRDPCLEAFDHLVGEWLTEMTHPAMNDLVVRGRVVFEWLEGERFLIQRATTDHADFPDSISVIGVMEGGENCEMQYFDSRGVHRLYSVEFDGKELRISRDEPGFAQRFSAELAADGSTLPGLWQLDRGDGYSDDLAITYRRA